MKCPACTETHLMLSERQGVEIDYCPRCRGIWLDRGELDKLLDRAVTAVHAAPASPPTDMPQGAMNSRSEGWRDGRYDQGDNRHDKRKKSWLHEIFD